MHGGRIGMTDEYDIGLVHGARARADRDFIGHANYHAERVAQLRWTSRIGAQYLDPAKLFSLEGRVAVVTGGSRGIGRTIAEGLVAAGCERVYITARKAAVVEETAAELGPKRIALPGDISTMAGIEALAEDLAQRETIARHPRQQCRCGLGADFEDFPEMGWDKVMNLNVKTPFFLTQKLHGLLKAGAKDHAAKVINIASVDGLRVNPSGDLQLSGFEVGAGAPDAAHGGAAGQGQHHRQRDLPGVPSLPNEQAAANHPEASARGIPLKRIGDLEDMAGGAIFLASRAGDYVIGTPLPIDGGIVNAAYPDNHISPLGVRPCSRAVRQLADGFHFGEGPRWHQGRPVVQRLLQPHHPFACDMAGDHRIELELDDQPSGLGWMPDGSPLFVSMRKRQVWRRCAGRTAGAPCRSGRPDRGSATTWWWTARGGPTSATSGSISTMSCARGACLPCWRITPRPIWCWCSRMARFRSRRRTSAFPTGR
jgi:NAD(P)-dependent dehydrogenase (short-subunit alcohol dehydrogenase family)